MMGSRYYFVFKISLRTFVTVCDTESSFGSKSCASSSTSLLLRPCELIDAYHHKQPQ
jgi:hypothetical protein